MNKLFCGIDLGTRSSSVCIINESKEVVHRWKGTNGQLFEELKKHVRLAQLCCTRKLGPESWDTQKVDRGYPKHLRNPTRSKLKREALNKKTCADRN